MTKVRHTHISDLAKETQPPDKGILSRTLFNDDRLDWPEDKTTLQDLTEENES
jgi:hypothetical protein